MLRKVPLPVYAFLGVILLIIMIGGVTLLASNLIGETVQDQFETQQTQTANSAARQFEAYVTQLSIEAFALSQNEAIRSVAGSRVEPALTAIDDSIDQNSRRDVISSVSRFWFADDGIRLRYIYPEPLNTIPFEFSEAQAEVLASATPEDASSSIYRLSGNNSDDSLYVLVVPIIVDIGSDERVEYLGYNLVVPAIMSDVFDDVIEDLNQTDTGQIWVFDYEGNIIFRSGAALQSGTPADVYGQREIIDISDTELRRFTLGDTEYLGVFSPADLLGRNFVLLVSRDRAEATGLVAGDLQLIFAISVAALLLIASMIGFGVWQLLSVSAERQEQQSVQRATRTLLEVSRALNSSLNFEQVMEQILTELHNILPYYSASILLLNNRGELEVSAHRGDDKEIHDVGSFSIEETSAAREVITSGKPVIIADTSQDERWTLMEGSEIRSWMGLPLRMRDEFVGVLNINGNHANGFENQDIEMAEAFADQASVSLQNARLHDRDVTRIERELTLARSIQSSLLPSKDSFEIPHLDIAFESEPARQVSGDYFQLVPLPDGQYGIFVGDVSGKGMPAALIMAVITTALRDEIIRNREPGGLLNRLNERLLERLLQVQMNSALIAAVFNPATYEISIANAGMVQPYWRTPQYPWDFVDIGGYPLGASQRTNYSHRVVKLPSGSMMVLFSDGIIEAQDSRGEFFGFERLEALLETLSPDIDVYDARDRILTAVKRHLGNQDPQDDMTVMVLRTTDTEHEAEIAIDGAAPPAEAVSEPEVIKDNTSTAIEPVVPVVSIATQVTSNQELTDEEYIMPRENVEIFIPSILGFEKVARSAAEALARQMGLEAEKIEDVKTAVAEAVMNAIEHGNLEDKATSVTVMFSASDDHLEIRVQDRGRQIVPNPLPVPGSGDSSRGWGIFFMQSLMDEFEISRSPEGNEIRMTIFVNKEESEGESSDENEATPSDSDEWVDQGES